MFAEALRDQDTELFETLREHTELVEAIASTFQLSYLLLKTVPAGKWTSPPSADLRDEAFSIFAAFLEEKTDHAATFAQVDPISFTTAVTTIVMENIVPLMDGDNHPDVNATHEGVGPRSFYVALSLISWAAIEAFAQYSPLIDQLEGLEFEVSNANAQEYLTKLLPAVIGLEDRLTS